MSRELLVEYLPFTIAAETISEAMEKNNGRLVVTGPLQRADTRNQNGRIYPRNILVREAKKYKGIIGEKRALGELDHPESSIVNLKNVSHNIIDMWWENNNLLGKVEVLSTPSGNILKELFKSGIKLGISSRGLGSVKPMEEGLPGTVAVQDDFELVAFDFVSNPSTHGAFLSPIAEGYNPETIAVCGKWCKAQDLMREIIMEVG